METLEMFGAYVRAEQKADSDLDVLVTFRGEPSLLTFMWLDTDEQMCYYCAGWQLEGSI